VETEQAIERGVGGCALGKVGPPVRGEFFERLLQDGCGNVVCWV
jgi:hypothetical protein